MRRTCAVAESAEVRRDHQELLGKRSHHLRPHLPGVWEPCRRTTAGPSPVVATLKVTPLVSILWSSTLVCGSDVDGVMVSLLVTIGYHMNIGEHGDLVKTALSGQVVSYR